MAIHCAWIFVFVAGLILGYGIGGQVIGRQMLRNFKAYRDGEERKKAMREI